MRKLYNVYIAHIDSLANDPTSSYRKHTDSHTYFVKSINFIKNLIRYILKYSDFVSIHAKILYSNFLN